MNPNIRKILSAAEYVETHPNTGQALEINGIGDSEQVLIAYMLNDITLCHHGLGICRDNVVIKDCITHDCHIAPILSQFGDDILASGESINIEGEFVSLVGTWCAGFWHWMMEYLPKLLMAETLGFGGKYIIPPVSSNFIVESLLLLDEAATRRKKISNHCILPNLPNSGPINKGEYHEQSRNESV